MRCQAARIILDYTRIYFKYDLIVLGDDGCVWSAFIEAALGACACQSAHFAGFELVRSDPVSFQTYRLFGIIIYIFFSYA